MTVPRPILALLLATALAGCTRKAPEGPVDVSVIGPAAVLEEPGRNAPPAPEAALLGAVAQGLVRFDANAQIAPGLAMRWAISDDGLFYTFRLIEGVDADRAARAIRRAVARLRGGLLGSTLGGINEVVAVTPEVIEIWMKAPRPDLMRVLADPQFAMLPGGKGLGPLTLSGKPAPIALLRPILTEADKNADGEIVPDPRFIRLRGERAALAVAHFRYTRTRLVTGGTFADLIYPKLAGVDDRALLFDPVNGLFGLRIASNSPFLGAVEVRQALSAALNRAAIGERLGVPNWRSSETIQPDLAGAPPRRPIWARLTAPVTSIGRGTADPLAPARSIIAAWASRHGGELPVVRIALPDGPGSRLLFIGIAQSWRAIGVEVVRVDGSKPADMRLVDEVAPSDEPEWYLAHFLCDQGRPCSSAGDDFFRAAQASHDPGDRMAHIREAEDRIAAAVPFIPIAQPVRWSLVAPGLDGFATNVRATHPLPPLIGR
jgi:peptide/nickel transport system substrate-binding protein